jgi:dephospho-CoA kinase
MLKIALTGGIGSGKSAVADLFAQHGIAIIDTDVIARAVVEPDTVAWKKLVDHFGPSILLPTQHVNRALLREKIFTDPQERQWLEALLHPLIRTKMITDIEHATSPYCIAVIPLLTAHSHENLFDRTLVITTDTETRLQRIIARDRISRGQAQAMIDAQITDVERLAFADDVINNNCSTDELATTVDNLHQFYLKLS